MGTQVPNMSCISIVGSIAAEHAQGG